VEDVDNRSDIREFLATRRAKLSPEQAGLPAGGGRRRVPGLRREEVAVLAGVSTEWYTRLEKGHITGVSDDVLDAVARALQLNEAERTYLYDLARAARPTRRPTRRRRRGEVQPRVQWMLDSITTSAAFVRNGRMDILAANTLGRALYWPTYAQVPDGEPRLPNIARYQFLDPSAADYFPNWDGAANVTVALLRAEAGRDPHNKDLRDLVGELSTLSDEFRARWAAHDVRIHRAGAKQFRHPEVGLLDLVYHSVNLAADEDYILDMTIYTAEPASASEERLKVLASWAATVLPAETVTRQPH
jgi:transcriptional regulator with XRE-family HTH domain